MKLFTRYSRINVLATIIIFLISSIAYYFILNYVLVSQIDDDLEIEQREVTVYVNKYGRLPDSLAVEDQILRFAEAKGKIKRHFSTAYFPDPEENETDKFRQIFFGIEAGGRWYVVEVDKSLEKTDSIVHSVLLVTLATILLILAASFIINRVVLKRIWKPFYNSLNKVKDFQVSQGEPLNFPSTPIDEFRFMNDTLEKITGQAQTEYVALKTFSENASHEIQTPIAIVRSKLDLILQEEGLSEKQSQGLQAAYNSIQKLSRLNHSLLLLAKIENRQFQKTETIDFKNLLSEKIDEFHELWLSQKVNVHSELGAFHADMNPELAELLVNNLLSNATRHNHPGGAVWIQSGDAGFRITNTSLDEPIEEAQLYNRFFRSQNKKEGNGLGLSIIRQICDTSGLSIRYEAQAGTHSFIISHQ